jgi:RimJ/RimL family protein N-acetyltransferase
MLAQDITDDYLHWINDPEVTRFLEVRFSAQSRSDLVEYVKSNLDPANKSLHLGVFDQEGSRLVGTVTFHSMDEHHLSACISFVIGHPEARRKGYGSEAVHAATHYMLNVRGFLKLWGGYYEGHIASEKIFLKNGYRIEGRLKQKLVDYQGNRVDHMLVGICKNDFVPDKILLMSDQISTTSH